MLAGDRPFNEVADVWSLGCVLYHMLCLQQPFTGTNLLSVVSSIVSCEYPPVPDTYSDTLRDLVASMLTRDPAERPTIADVALRIAPQLMKQLDRSTVRLHALEHHVKQASSRAPPSSSGRPSLRKTGSGSPLLSSLRVTVSPHAIRAVGDPYEPLFRRLHQLMVVTDLPPSLRPDARVLQLKSFRQHLFSGSAAQLKLGLKKLQDGVSEAMELDSGRATFAELRATLDAVVEDMGFTADYAEEAAGSEGARPAGEDGKSSESGMESDGSDVSDIASSRPSSTRSRRGRSAPHRKSSLRRPRSGSGSGSTIGSVLPPADGFALPSARRK
eukprot:PLAT3665.3.p1 GENE.PLAT3665.3~~PLAT3665.3.p1  ORF type:complete len:329 (-),score=121.77 PLAT3665.3:42-1028(-)